MIREPKTPQETRHSAMESRAYSRRENDHQFKPGYDPLSLPAPSGSLAMEPTSSPAQVARWIQTSTFPRTVKMGSWIGRCKGSQSRTVVRHSHTYHAPSGRLFSEYLTIFQSFKPKQTSVLSRLSRLDTARIGPWASQSKGDKRGGNCSQ